MPFRVSQGQGRHDRAHERTLDADYVAIHFYECYRTPHSN